MAKTSVKSENDWPKTIGVALSSQLLTNGQTDERTGHCTPISHLRANAGATKVWFKVYIGFLISALKHRPVVTMKSNLAISCNNNAGIMSAWVSLRFAQ